MMKNNLLRYAYPLAVALLVVAGILFFRTSPNPPAMLAAETLQPERAAATAFLDEWKTFGLAGPQTRSDSIALALDDYQNHRYPQAEAAFRQYLGKYPGDSIAAFYLALSLLYQGQYRPALDILPRLAELQGFSLRDDARWYLALAAANTDPKAALGLFSRISRDPGSRYRQQAKAVLSALPSHGGTFSFRIQPQAMPGQPAEQPGSTLVLTVQNPWWQNPWARAFLLLLPACAIGLLFWRNRLEKRNRAGIEHAVALRTGELNRQKDQLQKEKERSEEILLNILPQETADELRKYGHSDARRYEKVTVLFCDFKEFTRISEELSPEDLVASLGQCFEAYDHIVTAKGLEKIKTVGDCYICAGGLTLRGEDEARKVIEAARDMLAFLRDFNANQQAAGRPVFEARIGIHTGTVVAGIVGIKKYAYDIWGDTVNIAARMEQNSEGGRINISGSTYELVKADFACQYRGKVDAKGKGAVDMYFVN